MSDIPDATPDQAWAALMDDPDAALVDVRTDAEWTYVGVPDLAAMGKPVHRIAWQVFPAMAINEGFIDALAGAGLTPSHRLYFMCRSGARSLAAAKAATAAGYGTCFNVADGFEGPLDDAGHRRMRGGWVAAGLPWRQA